MRPLYDFGFSQEDERSEIAGLELRPGARTLAVTSGGEMPLAFAAFGASSVVSVDIAPSQNRLARLKLAAALALPSDEALGLLGYTRAPVAARRAAYRAVRLRIPMEDAAFWDANPRAVDRGVIWAGRFERFLGWLQLALTPILGRWALRGLFEQPDLASQAAWFDAHIGTAWMRAGLRLAFSRRVYADRGVAARALDGLDPDERLGDRYFAQLRDLCTRAIAADNPWLQLVLLGELVDPAAAPPWLRPPGAQTLSQHAAGISWVDADLVAWLDAAPPGQIDAFHLSNVIDWVDERAWERLLGAVVRAAAPGARVVWRCMHTDRPVPAALADRIVPDRALGERLRHTDRFPFYTLVPAALR